LSKKEEMDIIQRRRNKKVLEKGKNLYGIKEQNNFNKYKK
jgi:hypothetical protein